METQKQKVFNNAIDYLERHGHNPIVYHGVAEPDYWASDTILVTGDWWIRSDDPRNKNPVKYRCAECGNEIKWSGRPKSKENKTFECFHCGKTTEHRFLDADLDSTRVGGFFEKYDFGKGIDVKTDWYDEWTSCEVCGKAVRTSPDCWTWQRYYTELGGWSIVCHDCITIDDILEHYANCEPITGKATAIPSELIDRIKEEGFHCPSDKECPKFRSGWSGRTDTPESTIEAYSKFMECDSVDEFREKFDYIYAITGVDQWDVDFTMFIRSKNI